MLKKLKELFGFPTEQEKADAKTEVAPAPVVSENVFAFPTTDKPEVQAKPKAKRAPKPKAEPAAKAPAKKPAAKKPAARKPAVKKTKQA